MVAAINLARPYSNAQQEHDFSMATWFDGNLVQRQKPLTLEEEAGWFAQLTSCQTDEVLSTEIEY